MARPCWICGTPDSTQEHVWPEWLQKLVFSGTVEQGNGATADPAAWPEWTGAEFEHTRVLCAPCNQRFGEVEEQVSQLVPVMAGGTSLRLDTAEQEALAQWIYKTGLMVPPTHRDKAKALPRSHYFDLEKSLDLPPISAVWIAQVEKPAYPAGLWLQRYDWQDRELAEPPIGEGFIFAVSVADLAGVVAVLHARQSPGTEMLPFELAGLAWGRLLKIWPALDRYGVSWPPTQKLTASEFRQLADSLPRLSSDRRRERVS